MVVFALAHGAPGSVGQARIHSFSLISGMKLRSILMICMRFISKSIVLVFVSVISFNACAGVLLREQERAMTYSTLFQDNVIYHFEEGRLMALLDLAHNHCTIASEEVMTQGSCSSVLRQIQGVKKGSITETQATANQPKNLTVIEAELTEISGYAAQRYDLVYEGNVVQSVWASTQLRTLIDAEISSKYVQNLRELWWGVRIDDTSLKSAILKQVEKIGQTAEILRLAKPASYASSSTDDLSVERELIGVEIDEFFVDDYLFAEDLRVVDVDELVAAFRFSGSNGWLLQ